MANFSLSFTPVLINATGNAWVDPVATLPNPYGGAPLAIPSRQNARYGLPHRYTRFLVNQEVRVFLTPTGGGPIAPPDSALGGNLFLAWFAEVPTGMISWNSVPGQSATQFFTPVVVGGYCAVFMRSLGGGIVFHFTVEAS